MTNKILELEMVRVAKLNEPARPVIGSGDRTRQPRPGDMGTVVAVLGKGEKYTVECVDENGMTAWLCDFDADELETIRIA